MERFPGVNFTVVVDYSKYHDVRIDSQLETDTLVPDVVALQTLQDFPRWAKSGDLLPYKPANFSKIHDSLKENDGAWMAYSIYSFSFIYNTIALCDQIVPVTPADLVNPQWAGKIASSYPHDDDAVLFLFTRYEKVIGVGTSGGGEPIKFVTGNGTEYLSRGQRVGILSKAKHPAVANLFMNWVILEEVQMSLVSSSARTDTNTANPWEIPEGNMAVIPLFMKGRAKVEQWKQTFALYFGEVHGEPSPGILGLHPGL
ncbi:hypothetical protein JG688_00002006 [Phytophthora aleatoria]|uniref:PBP domain-containing protein n=1 Tax=Phytophthora aleatoria TaxID=2496075 RepID=A0A8J5J3H8_9STRA|nr:hypothetical protein JG688_00002006 [Phytophthora aleatoria]